MIPFFRRQQSRRHKERCEVKHSIQRARERYGLDLTSEELRQVANRLNRGDGRFLSRESHSRDVWEVEVKGVACVVVFNGMRKTIRTFLPPRTESVELYVERIGQYFGITA